MNPDEKYDIVPLCECESHQKKKIEKMTERTRQSFRELMKIMEKKYGKFKIVSVGRGEGSFGIAICISTEDDKYTFIIKTQKCQTCSGKTTHTKTFMKEINAINKVIKDSSYVFLMPYICAYYPTQKDVYWFEGRPKESLIELHPKPSIDAISLGLIVMKSMERTLLFNAEERRDMTSNTINRGGWLSFVWSGSLLGIMAELILSGSFHGDLKEENIVGEQMISNDPFSYIWKAIDFGGSGNASSMADFAQSMYTPHYQPIMGMISKKISNRNYTWIHDVLALAHVVRNLCSFMTSTTRHTTPYSNKNNLERFLLTQSDDRGLLTVKVLKELPGDHKGIMWCKEWIKMLIEEDLRELDVMEWCKMMLRGWLKTCMEMLDEKPKITKRVPIQSRMKKLVGLLKSLK